MNNLSISDSKRQGFALKVILWAANNGILEKLIKSESQKIKVNSERSKKHVAEYKIQSIGNIALFTVFREEAEEVELRKRCFINNIDISDYFPEKDHNYIYLSNQWNENGDNNLTLEGLVSTINSEINPDYECGFFKNQNEMYIFYVIANQNEVICKNADISPKQQEEIISSLEEVHTLSKYKANKRLSKTTKYNYLIEEFDNQSLIQKFQFRLQTQERKRYSQSKISFFTRLFNQIDKDHFSDWCNNQIDKIEYYTKDGEIISTKQISSFIVKDGCVFIKKGNDSAEFELFFKYEEEFHSFKDFISDVRYVSLDRSLPIHFATPRKPTYSYNRFANSLAIFIETSHVKWLSSLHRIVTVGFLPPTRIIVP